jgi:Mce-associated membrane protein
MPRGKARRAASAESVGESEKTDGAEESEADQSSEAGEAPTEEATEAPAEEATGEATEAPAAEVTGEADAEPTEESDPGPVQAERRPPGRFAAAAIGVAVALFVASAAFGGSMLYSVVADRAAAATKLEVARTAASAITTLWTYTPEDMDQLADRSARYLGGDFLPQYRKYIDAIVPTNRQAQVTNSTEVVGAAVESLDGPHAVAIVYTNSTSTSPLTKNIPSLRYLSWRLTMEREGSRWLVTAMAPITSLDLTPQI